MSFILSKYFYPERIYIDRTNDNNRNELFVEVDQPELMEKIFRPLYNVKNNSFRFFYKRFAILGDFKVGKTELGAYIRKKIEEFYTPNNLISITINTEEARLRTKLNIKSWIYREWLTELRQIEQPGFKKVVLKILREFELERGYKCEDINRKDFLDIINLITRIYKEYLKINKQAKFIVEFDQANVIYRNEEEFTPFYQFWRNFQGFWEVERYFANLGLFIYVIGHINWKGYALLKDPSGEGIFDVVVLFKHWTNSDVQKMLEKRLIYALKPEYKKEISYFLPNGIVDFLRNKLGKVNVYEYLKCYLGPDGYLEKFFKNFKINKTKYRDLLDFCKKVHQKTETDNTYFKEIERLFVDNLDSDYMQVFLYLSDYQDEPWFDVLFKLIDKLYEDERLLFGSTFFNKELKHLDKDFLRLKFSYDFKNGSTPELMPPILVDYERDLRLDRTFRELLLAIPSDKRGGATTRLKKYIQSKRLQRKDFLESKDGEEMISLLQDNIEISNNIMKIFNIWLNNGYHGILSKRLEYNDKIRVDFLSIQNRTFTIYQFYKGNSTKWALFDDNVRTLGIFIVEELLPQKSQIKNYIDLSEFKNIIRSPLASNIEITRILNGILSNLLKKIKIFDSVLKERNKNIKKGKDGIEEIGHENIFQIINKGEGKTTEFKSSLRWCFKTEKKQSYIEEAIIKTISGFMNTEGGILLIGIDDDGNVNGLDCDYATFKKENKDFFSQHLSHILERDIGIQFSNYWDEKFIEIDSKEICMIEVRKSSKPSFTKVKNEEKFFIRSGSTTKSLKPSEQLEYIKMNFE